jgi:3-hydroxyisobutyrate dehydrogenase-like beta-hydroxyacid dehydrogenase
MAAVGVVGLGVMGCALSRRLLASGHEVRGHDVSPDATGRAAALGVAPASLEALAELPIVLTSLPDDDAAAAVLLPPDGLAAQLRQGATIVELSTLLPRTVRAVDAAARSRGVRVVDCAVS